eukprot:Phypoly_transcript_04996.p1 GENE.Phypoly_transcript_04996~~Phypoly_transcript_04996.p1  ORF type:complete len:342 (-),score=75.83 Phypoly_transcript_04996:117-1142(-)
MEQQPNPHQVKAANYVDNVNFADPEAVKTIFRTIVAETMALREERNNLQAQLDALSASNSAPPPAPAKGKKPKPEALHHEPTNTRPFKGDKFSGEKGSIDIEEYLRKVTLQCEMDSTPNHKRTLVIQSGLTGRAYQEFTAHAEVHPLLTYNEIKVFLRERFTDTAKSDNAYRQIHQIKQYGQIREFNKIFNKHLLDIKPRPAENLLIAAYTNAIKRDLAIQLWAQKPDTLIKAMTLTESLEDLIKAHENPFKPSKTPFSSPTTRLDKTPSETPFRGTARQLHFNQMPAWMAELPEKQQALFKKGKCVWCGEKYTIAHGKECNKRRSHVNVTETDEVKSDSE